VSFDAIEDTLTCTLDREGITLSDIPITLFGNPDSYITTPTMTKGTKGLLIFSKHDLRDWVEDGVDSEAKLDFAISNAFFLIGATNQKNKIPYNMNAIEIKTNKAIEIKSTQQNSTTSETKISLLAPKISLTNSVSGEELFSLLVDTLNEMKDLATTLSQSRDQTYNLLLTNSTGIASFIDKFDALSQKYGDFK
jgi:hypothetical protein